MNRKSLRAPCAALPLAALAASLFPLSSALAQAGGPALAPVVVTATRTAQPLTDLVADVSVIDREQIERSGALNIADLLARQPGLAFTRNGGPGGTTSLQVRGAETRHTALFIDGVRIDPQDTGGPSWHAIALSQVERIEVLRGPATAVYGSDAIGGVVQVFTRRGEGPVTPSVTVGAGSHGTRLAEASLRGGTATLDWAIGLGRERSRGFDLQPGAGDPDRDGFRRESASASLGLQVAPGQRLEASALFSDLSSQIDGVGPGADDRAHTRIASMSLGWNARWSDAWSTRATLSQGRDRYALPVYSVQSRSRVDGYLLQSEWRVGIHQLTAALERREDHREDASTTPTATQRTQDSLALGWGLRQGAHTLQVNARHDRDSEFGAHATGSVAYAFAFTPQWRATASAGTAFRTPTLYQRFSEYGIPGLRPEHSRNREVGLKYAQGASEASVVAYRNDVRDLITFVYGPGPCPSSTSGAWDACYDNTDRARLSGVTLAGAHRLGDVALRGSLDLQDPVDQGTGKLLQRRARQLARLSADTRMAGWRLGSELQFTGRRFDDAQETRRLGAYTLVSLYASTDLARDWRLLARVDNLAGKDYQTARGYATGGRTFLTTLQWQPR